MYQTEENHRVFDMDQKRIKSLRESYCLRYGLEVYQDLERIMMSLISVSKSRENDRDFDKD